MEVILAGAEIVLNWFALKQLAQPIGEQKHLAPAAICYYAKT